MASTVKVKTLDHKIFEIDGEIARCSKTISMMMDICLSRNLDIHNAIIPFRDWVHSKELTLIINWLKHDKHSKTLSEDMETACGDTPDTNVDAIPPELLKDVANCSKDVEVAANIWDAKFIEAMDQSTLMDLIITVNYLNIEGLLEFLCRVITGIIVGKTYEEVCKACSPKTQLTEDEIDYLYNENPCLLLGHCEDQASYLRLNDEYELTPEVEDEYFGCDDFSTEDFQCSNFSHRSILKKTNSKEKKD